MALAFFLGVQLLLATALSQTPFVRQVQFAAVIAGLIPNGLFFIVILAYALGAAGGMFHLAAPAGLQRACAYRL